MLAADLLLHRHKPGGGRKPFLDGLELNLDAELLAWLRKKERHDILLDILLAREEYDEAAEVFKRRGRSPIWGYSSGDLALADRFAAHRPDVAIYSRPCVHRTDFPPCRGDNLCMQAISPARVYAAACQRLGGARGKTGGVDPVQKRQLTKIIPGANSSGKLVNQLFCGIRFSTPSCTPVEAVAA